MMPNGRGDRRISRHDDVHSSQALRSEAMGSDEAMGSTAKARGAAEATRNMMSPEAMGGGEVFGGRKVGMLGEVGSGAVQEGGRWKRTPIETTG